MKTAALIGLGMVANTHVAACRDARNVTLKGVWGRNSAKARRFSEQLPVSTGTSLTVYPNLEALASDPDIDFVILATPPDARTALVEQLAASGKPILMEKPIERDLAAATRIVEICEHSRIPLGVVFQHRARAASIALKQAVEAGALGQIVSAEIRIPWWRDQSYYDALGRGTRARDGGGVMLTQAIHTLDLALWFLGPVQRVQAAMRLTDLHQMECEDWAGAFLETTQGCIASLFATTAAFPGDSETISLHGSKGSAHLEAGVLTMRFQGGQVETVGAAGGTGGGADPMAFTHAWHQAVIEDFANSLETADHPLASGREALLSHAVIDAMERSSASGNWVAAEAP